MKAAFAFALALVSACQPHASPVRPVSESALRLAADVDTLASRALDGRRAGTPGADSAADFIARRYQRLGLGAVPMPGCDQAVSCGTTYFQIFRNSDGAFHNVVAFVEGLDSARRTDFVVVGAHFDHLGHSPTFAMDRRAGFVLRPGADDNASGTAAVLELARRFAGHAARRSILVVNFDAEEEGLVGSRAMLATTPIPRAAMVFMLNLDMVGRLRGDQLYIASRHMAPGVRAVFDTAAKAVGIHAEFTTSDDRSDHASFEDDGIAAAELTTGMHADYHKASDVPNRLNIEGLDRVVDLAEFVVRRIADR